MQTKQNGGTPELVDLQLLAREREGKCRTVRDDCHEAGNSSQISEQTNFRPGTHFIRDPPVHVDAIRTVDCLRYPGHRLLSLPILGGFVLLSYACPRRKIETSS